MAHAGKLLAEGEVLGMFPRGTAKPVGVPLADFERLLVHRVEPAHCSSCSTRSR